MRYHIDVCAPYCSSTLVPTCMGHNQNSLDWVDDIPNQAVYHPPGVPAAGRANQGPAYSEPQYDLVQDFTCTNAVRLQAILPPPDARNHPHSAIAHPVNPRTIICATPALLQFGGQDLRLHSSPYQAVHRPHLSCPSCSSPSSCVEMEQQGLTHKRPRLKDTLHVTQPVLRCPRQHAARDGTPDFVLSTARQTQRGGRHHWKRNVRPNISSAQRTMARVHIYHERCNERPKR